MYVAETENDRCILVVKQGFSRLPCRPVHLLERSEVDIHPEEQF